MAEERFASWSYSDLKWKYIEPTEERELPPLPANVQPGTEEWDRALRRDKTLAAAWFDFFSKIENVDLFLKWCINITDKNGNFVRLDVDNPAYQRAQRYLLGMLVETWKKTGSFRAVVLKARQWGCSTLIQGLWIWGMLFNKNFRAAVALQDREKSEAMLETIRIMVDGLPTWITPNVTKNNKGQINFNGFPTGSPLSKHARPISWIRVFTASSSEFARSLSIRGFHGSEVAYWPERTAKLARNAVSEAVSSLSKGSMVFWESTGYGFGGIMPVLWNGAASGSNFHVPIFVPWFWIMDYCLDAEQVAIYFPAINFQEFSRLIAERKFIAAGLDEEEIDLVSRYDILPGQILWRRFKIAEKDGDILLFRREYPSTPQEAFIISGETVFSQSAIMRMRDKARDPVRRFWVINEDPTNVWPEHMKISESPVGNVKVFTEPNIMHEYLVVVDPSEGSEKYISKDGQDTRHRQDNADVKEGDETAICVIDRNKKSVVCTARGRIPPDVGADIMMFLAYMYNRAMIVVENNKYAGTYIGAIKDTSYESVYLQKVYDQTINEEMERIGFTMTGHSRPLAFSTARGQLRSMQWDIPDSDLLDQLSSMIYKRTTNAGFPKEQASPGAYDDLALAFTIGVQVNKELGEYGIVGDDRREHLENVYTKNFDRYGPMEREYYAKKLAERAPGFTPY